MSATRKNLKPVEQGSLARADLNKPGIVVTMALTPLDTDTEASFAISPEDSLRSKKKSARSVEYSDKDWPAPSDYAPQPTLNLQDKVITSL